MKYIEINENYSPEDDEFNSIDLEDTRKVRLTLAHLSKLRKIREYRKYQKGAKQAQVKHTRWKATNIKKKTVLLNQL